MARLLLLYLLGYISSTFAQTICIDSLPTLGILLNQGWRYHPSDNAAWASPSWDDQGWQPIDPTKPLQELTQLPTQGIGWLRLHLQVGDKLRQLPVALSSRQFCALDIYFNGRLLYRYGLISTQTNGVS